MFALRLIAFCLLFGLAGCGFRPLYQTHQGAISDKLRMVKISTIENREGQILHNRLCQMFGIHDHISTQKYVLKVILNYNKEPLAISKSASTVEESIYLDVRYTLSHLESGKEIFSAHERVSVDSTVSAQSPYANWVGEKSAQERLLYEAAENIRTTVTAALEEVEHS